MGAPTITTTHLLIFFGFPPNFIQDLRWVRHSESDPIDLLICGSPKRPPKTCQKETEKEEGDAKAPPQASPPPTPHAETPTPSQQPAAPACLPLPSSARLPTRLLQPNLVIRETLPTQLTK